MPTTPNPSIQDRTRRSLPAWSLALWSVIIVAALAVIGIKLLGTGDPQTGSVTPSIVAGTPGGSAVANATPGAVVTPLPEPTPAPAELPTPEATPTPTSRATPRPTTPVPATAAPTPIVVAAGSPDDAVAAFYSNVVAGRYDAAYGLWSERMRTTYPRTANLDDRFDETASIAFEQLYVAEHGANSATVQANFVETYESGSSRRFIGYWRLVLIDGRWLLDEPTY